MDKFLEGKSIGRTPKIGLAGFYNQFLLIKTLSFLFLF